MTSPIIRIGNQTAFSELTPLAPFDFAVAKGFCAFEWFPDKRSDSGAGWEESDLSAEDRDFIKRIALDRDIRLSVHAPWWADPVLPGSEKILSESLAFDKDIGACLFNLHLYTEQGIDAYAEAIRPLIEQTAGLHIQLSIENTPLTSPEDFNELFAKLRMRRSLDISHMGMCLDLGHANLCDVTRNDFLGFFDRLDPQVPIIHVHLHENYGDEDSHLTVFTGPSAHNPAGIEGFVERLKHRRYSGAIIMEQWPQPPELLIEAYEELSRMIDRIFEMPDQKEKEKDKGKTFFDILVEGNRQCRSWREKLGMIQGLLLDETSPFFPPGLDDLVYIAVYLRFLGTGEIECSEDGRHFRPSRHAAISQEIHQNLIQRKTPENALLLRKIYPWLPSYGAPYLRAEPLTRIRDIAHRNDCPPAIKKEIKHILQNKLHRCAAPEDLAVSADLLKRITLWDSGCSPEFIAQFERFHEELKEFFNASTLQERLKAIVDSLKEQEALMVQQFLSEGNNADSLEQQIRGLAHLTALRSQLLPKWENKADARAQKLRLIDVGLEDNAFVRLSRIILELSTAGMRDLWPQGLETLSLALTNLKISAMGGEEIKSIRAEVNAWRRDFNTADREMLLRLKATLDRGERMISSYSLNLLDLLCRKAEQLGQALGVADHARAVFCEGELRGDLIFQLSKIISLLKKELRIEAGLTPWDVVVTGAAAGYGVSAGHISELENNKSRPNEPLLHLNGFG